MREIGGYFGLDNFSGREYHPEAVAVNTARNGLLYLLKARNARKVYLPEFLCDSVSRVCQREGYAFSFYPVDKRFRPAFDQTPKDGEFLYVVNYYGQISNETVMEWKRRYGNLILDNVQAFFQEPVPGIDTLYSCRKFFGVPDGAYVATDFRLGEPLPVDHSESRMRHVLGRCEGKASDFYGDFCRNEESFYDLELRAMSKVTRNLLRALDYAAIRKKREENYEILHRALGKKNRLDLRPVAGPYAYPFYCENGPAAKKKLAETGIYIPTLWPSAIPFGSVAKEYSENILPLPVDQRYEAEDIEYLMEELRKCTSI